MAEAETGDGGVSSFSKKLGSHGMAFEIVGWINYDIHGFCMS